MYMIMFVLDDPDRLDEVLNAWEKVGLGGATIVESTGINRLIKARLVGTTVMAGINRLMSSAEESHFTLFAIVENEAMVKIAVEAVEAIVGDLNNPHNGVLAAWPLTTVKGVPSSS